MRTTASGVIVPGVGTGLLIGGTAALDSLWRCPMPGCDVTYGKGQDKAIARHSDSHDDELRQMALDRDNEPLREIDEEQVAFLKRQAVAAGDPTVRGH